MPKPTGGREQSEEVPRTRLLNPSTLFLARDVNLVSAVYY